MKDVDPVEMMHGDPNHIWMSDFGRNSSSKAK